MEKKVSYKGDSYTIELKWSGQEYGVRCVESKSGFKGIPFEYLKGDKADIEKIKPIIIQVIENNHDLKLIEQWDGIL